MPIEWYMKPHSWAERNRLFVATGDSYSNPPAKESDAIMSLSMDTGRVLWVQQAHSSDAWNISCVEQGAGNVNCTDKAGPDFDFGSPAILTKRPDGRDVLVAGQKSGIVFAFDPDADGRILWQTRIGQGGTGGGIQWGMSSDGRNVYVASVGNAVAVFARDRH